MKHLASLFLLSFLIFCSCTQQMEDEWKPDESLPSVPETHPVGVTFSRASLETFAEHGITEIGIYVYLSDSLVYGENLPLNNGNLKVDVPLGERLRTFAVANADHLVDTDSLSKVIVYQDEQAQKEVYLSEVTEFMSDRTVSQVSLELKRIVGQATFQPSESGEDIAAITQFDRMNMVFTNVGIGYKVNTGECIQEDVEVSADLTSGFSASVYSFPTVGQNSTGLDLIYMKEGQEVNRTKRVLDTNIVFEVSKRTVVSIPVLDDSYLQQTFTRGMMLKEKTTTLPGLTIREYDF